MVINNIRVKTYILGVYMKNSFKLTLFIFLSILTAQAIEATEAAGALTPQEEELITDRSDASREKPNLYDFNRQNVQYNNRFDSGRDGSYYQSDRGGEYYPQYQDNFNQSNILDNTSPNLNINR